MALDARDIPVTREVVGGWLKSYDGSVPVRDYLAGKLNGLGMNETEVNTQEHESLSETTSLLDMICADLHSYGNSFN